MPKKKRINVWALYKVPDDSTIEAIRQWLVTSHYIDLCRALGARPNEFFVSDNDRDQAQVFMSVDEGSWNSYDGSSAAKSNYAAAKAHGFDRFKIMEERFRYSDDDSPPFGYGHGPESRGGSIESERGFSGGERG